MNLNLQALLSFDQRGLQDFGAGLCCPILRYRPCVPCVGALANAGVGQASPFHVILESKDI